MVRYYQKWIGYLILAMPLIFGCADIKSKPQKPKPDKKSEELSALDIKIAEYEKYSSKRGWGSVIKPRFPLKRDIGYELSFILCEFRRIDRDYYHDKKLKYQIIEDAVEWLRKATPFFDSKYARDSVFAELNKVAPRLYSGSEDLASIRPAYVKKSYPADIQREIELTKTPWERIKSQSYFRKHAKKCECPGCERLTIDFGNFRRRGGNPGFYNKREAGPK